MCNAGEYSDLEADLMDELEHLRSALDEAYTVINELDDEVHQLRALLQSRAVRLAFEPFGTPFAPYSFPTVELRDGS